MARGNALKALYGAVCLTIDVYELYVALPVFMTPAGHELPISGNVYNKYECRNIFCRLLMRGFWKALDGLIRRAQPRSIFECGCGEGYLSLRLLKMGYDVQGCDLDPGIVALANRKAEQHGYGRPFSVRDLQQPATESGIADLVICCEVLEHVAQPEAALLAIGQLARDWVVFSVPREPYWRIMNLLRLAYVRRLGNTPGHIQHWSAEEFAALVSTRFEIIERRTPFPWTFLLCRKRPA